MATSMNFGINYVDSDIDYNTTPADYILLDLVNDYLIWSETLEDLMTHEPTPEELNENAVIIDADNPVTIARCLLQDYSHDIGGAYYTHLVKGMGENNRYVFLFNFDGATAMIPRLEAWDDSDHDSADKNVLGLGTPADSFVKAVKTTDSLPGADWVGTPIAGADDYLELDTAALTGAKDLYCNLKITIPADYATPSAETFCLTIRFTWL